MKVAWSEVPQSVIHLAEELIEKYHPDLQEAEIGIVFRSEPSTTGGKMTIGHAGKVPENIKPYLDTKYDFLIWIAETYWQSASDIQRRAILDHELCHCDYSDGKAAMVHHDIEEFNEIIERYGLWRVDLIKANMAFEKARQSPLPGMKTGKVGAVEVKTFQQALPAEPEPKPEPAPEPEKPTEPLKPEDREQQVDDLITGFLDNLEDKDDDDSNAE